MKFNEFKKSVLLDNKEEIILNKKVILQGKELLLLSFIKGEESNNLYALYKGNKEIIECTEDDMIDEEYEDISITNKEEMINNIKSSKENLNIFIKEMKIQDKLITFQSATCGQIESCNSEDVILIKHYIDLGIINEEWNEIHLENMIISKFEQSEEEYFPIIDYNKSLKVTLVADEQQEEELINYPFKIKIGKLEGNTKIYYNNKEFFYLDEVSTYDMWKDIYENLDEMLTNIEESEREEFKNQYLMCAMEECPKNEELLTLIYETKDDTQLRFLTKKYLQQVVEYSSTCSTMIAKLEEVKGINGYITKTDILEPISKNFIEEIDIELFSKYITIPSDACTFIIK